VDGQVTATPDVAPVALVADCLPVAVTGDGAVAMLHAGWRGLAAGIIGEGVRALRALGGEGPLVAAIGPGAGACCYEAGTEVHEAFADVADAHHGTHVDLRAVARRRLAEAGVEDVADLPICTICSDPDLLFSHRRDHGVTGRQAGLAWLT
jgi:YfiH family protein